MRLRRRQNSGAGETSRPPTPGPGEGGANGGRGGRALGARKPLRAAPRGGRARGGRGASDAGPSPPLAPVLRGRSRANLGLWGAVPRQRRVMVAGNAPSGGALGRLCVWGAAHAGELGASARFCYEPKTALTKGDPFIFDACYMFNSSPSGSASAGGCPDTRDRTHFQLLPPDPPSRHSALEPTEHAQLPPGREAPGTAHPSPGTALPGATAPPSWPRDALGFAARSREPG